MSDQTRESLYSYFNCFLPIPLPSPFIFYASARSLGSRLLGGGPLNLDKDEQESINLEVGCFILSWDGDGLGCHVKSNLCSQLKDL